jgi:uncharacterized protein YdeI (YjbR/CyaY-like superfamily)
MVDNKKLLFFPTQLDFREWLEKNHLKENELLVGFYKIGTGKPSLTWSESVDQALCFGWIDGIRRSIDDESYCIRFTPRKPASKWSAINIKKVEELTKLGMMKPEGLKVFRLTDEDKARICSNENQPVELPESYKKKFMANKKAWAYFISMPPSYQKITTRWVMEAKQEITRIRRLEILIKDSDAGQKIKPMVVGSKK